MCDVAHDKADIIEPIYNASKSEGKKIPFDYVPENFKSRGTNRSGRRTLKVNVLGIIDWIKKRKNKRRKK